VRIAVDAILSRALLTSLIVGVGSVDSILFEEFFRNLLNAERVKKPQIPRTVVEPSVRRAMFIGQSG